MKDNPPKLGVSSCLLGEAVRFDGGHKRGDYIKYTLSKRFQLVAFCPEVAIGIGIPRQPIQLYSKGNAVRALQVNDLEVDVTNEITAYADSLTEQIGSLSGYIFKGASPSCGLNDVKLFAASDRPLEVTSGLFAKRLTALFPELPVIDEKGLADLRSRNNFLERVLAYHRRQK